MDKKEVLSNVERAIEDKALHMQRYSGENDEETTQCAQQLANLIKVRQALLEESSSLDKNIDRGIDIFKTIVENGTRVVVVLMPIVIYKSMFEQGMEFEKEGTFVTTTMRDHLRMLNPFR